MTKRHKYRPIDFPALPVDLINRILGTELEPGPAHMSGLAHRHAATDHAADYPICIANLAAVIAEPTFIGQAPKHSENIELIRRVPGAGGAAVLVAVGIQLDADGRYRIKSMYLVGEAELNSKRAKGTIKPVLK